MHFLRGGAEKVSGREGDTAGGTGGSRRHVLHYINSRYKGNPDPRLSISDMQTDTTRTEL